MFTEDIINYIEKHKKYSNNILYIRVLPFSDIDNKLQNIFQKTFNNKLSFDLEDYKNVYMTKCTSDKGINIYEFKYKNNINENIEYEQININ